MTIWVVDTSALVFLAKLGHLDLPQRRADTVCVPRTVLNEVRARSDETTSAIEEASRSWLSVREVSDQRTE